MKFNHAKDCLDIIDYNNRENDLKRLLLFIGFRELDKIKNNIEIFSKTIEGVDEDAKDYEVGDEYNYFTVNLNNNAFIRVKVYFQQDDVYNFSFDIVFIEKEYKNLFAISYITQEDITFIDYDEFDSTKFDDIDEVGDLIDLIADGYHDNYNVDYDTMFLY